jgi:hypothetical protein
LLEEGEVRIVGVRGRATGSHQFSEACFNMFHFMNINRDKFTVGIVFGFDSFNLSLFSNDVE